MIRSLDALSERFPVLRDFAPALRRLPCVMQRAAADCGPACLAMVSAWLGSPVTLDELRRSGAVSTLGWRARDFVEQARRFGMRARPLRIDSLEQLEASDRPLILHWRFSHYVVLRRLRGGHAVIVDPAFGQQRITRAELDRNFTGVALWLERDESVAPRRPEPSRSAAWRLLPALLIRSGIGGRLLAAAAALQLLSLLPPLCASIALASLPAGAASGDLAALAVGMAALIVALGLVGWLRGQLAVLLRARIGLQLAAEVSDRLLGARYAALAELPQAELLARVQAQDEIRDVVSGLGVSLALDLLLVALAGTALWLLDPASAVVVLTLFGMAALVMAATSGARRQAVQRVFARNALAGGFQVQLVGGLETLRALGATAWAGERWSQFAVARTNADTQLGLIEARTATMVQGLGQFGPMGVALLVAASDGGRALGVGQALFVYTLAGLLFATLLRLLEGVRSLQRIGYQCERVSDLLSLPQSDATSSRPALHEAAGVRLSGVRFRHAPNAPWAVDGVDLELAPRSFTLVVGPSGGGKSTLLALLAGLQEPHEGEIRVDGAPVAQLDRARSRRPLVCVPQFPYLFAGSIRENIAIAAPDADLDAVRAAARLAAIDEDVMRLPMRYDTLVAEGGTGLSGGQRQRIALARALLVEPGVLVLDEATSALDAETEARVFANLARLDCTRILATHRVGLASLADRVVELVDGRVASDRPSCRTTQVVPTPFPPEAEPCIS